MLTLRRPVQDTVRPNHVPGAPISSHSPHAGQTRPTAVAAAAGTGVGWIYDATGGNITANTTETEADGAGKLYNTY